MAQEVKCNGTDEVDKLELIRGRGDKQQLIWRDHCYTLRCTANNKKRWQCVNLDCRRPLTTTMDCKSVLKFMEHNHDSVEGACEARKLRSRLIDSISSNPNQPTGKLCRTEIVKLHPDISAALPTQDALARSLRYYRAKQRPPLPKSRNELVVPDNFCKTKLNDRFLLYCDVESDDPLMIFASDFSLGHLCQADVVSCDATFDCVPTLFQQLFTLNYFYTKKLMPAVFVLSKRRTCSTYNRIFAVLLAHLNEKKMLLSPATVISDYEKSLLSSLASAFPQSKLQGCYFHFC